MFAEPDLLLHWAHAAGQQPLAVYGVALALLLAVFAAGWWLVRRYHVPHGQSTLPPLVYLAVRLAGGFAAIVVAAWVFTQIATALGAADGSMGRADQAFADTLRTHVPPVALQAFALLTQLGRSGGLRHAGVCAGPLCSGALAFANGFGHGGAGVFYRREPDIPARALCQRCGGRFCHGDGLAFGVYYQHGADPLVPPFRCQATGIEAPKSPKIPQGVLLHVL